MGAIEFIRENIGWLKDVFTLIFVGTGTVIAFLTYKRARATVLQPIRTEVIKKQSESLARLLQIISETDNSFENGLDYVKLVQVNVLLVLRDYGFVFKDHSEILSGIETDIAGWLHSGRKNVLMDVEVIKQFSTDSNEEKKATRYGAQKFEALKLGEVDVDKIYLTKQHSVFIKSVQEFIDDPFMPVSIQRTLAEMRTAINHNLTAVLKAELEQFLLRFSQTYFQDRDAPEFNPLGLYNSFNHSRIHHKATLLKLRFEIRKYLRVDEPW